MGSFSGFSPADDQYFFKSPKTGDPRFGELVLKHDQYSIDQPSTVLAGYPDDEGIQLNRGRVGAALGPDAVRSRFYKTSACEFHPSDLKLVDIGNLQTDIPLADRHENIKQAVHQALQRGQRWIGIGGGHDFGYPDGAGFLLSQKGQSKKPLVINFDAHLDVRPTDQGLSSGTPFYRLLTDPDLPNFDFYEVGIQRQCNSQEHIRWAQDKGARILFYEDLMMSGKTQLQYLMENFAETLISKRPTYISVDIDCFSASYAMGCSQAWPTGFHPEGLFPFLNVLFHRLDVQVMGIYEVSPPLDQDERTVKLASQMIHQFLGPIG